MPMIQTIEGTLQKIVLISEQYALLPEAKVMFRDPKKRTIIVTGSMIDALTGMVTYQYMIELPQGLISYQASKNEILNRIVVDPYQLVLVNGSVTNATSAAFAIKTSTDPLTVTRDDHFLIVKSENVIVELRY